MSDSDFDPALVEEQFSNRPAFERRLKDAAANDTSTSRPHRPVAQEEPRPRLRVVKNPFPLEALPPAAAEYAHKLFLNGIPTEYTGPAMLAVMAGSVGGRI